MARKEPLPHPWEPALYDVADIVAVRSVAQGVASADQQKRAVQWIVHMAAGTYDEPFRSNVDGGERDTSYALGKAKVGREIVKMVNMSQSVIDSMKTKAGRGQNG